MSKTTAGKGARRALPFIIIALTAMIFLSAISYFTLMSGYYDLEEQYIEVVNDQAIIEIESAVNFGKSLQNYYGMETLLHKSMQQFSPGYIIAITDDAGQGLYKIGGEDSSPLTDANYNSVSQAIQDKKGTHMGNFVTFYPKQEVKSQLAEARMGTVQTTCLLSVLVVAAIWLLSMRREQSKKVIVAIIITAMALQSGILLGSYQTLFRENVEQSAWGIGGYFALSLEQLSSKGIALSDIDDLNSYLSSMKKYDIIREVALIQSEGETGLQKEEDRLLIQVNVGNQTKIETETSMAPLYLAVDISKAYISNVILEMALTFMATIAIVFVFTLESIRLPQLIQFRKTRDFNKACSGQYQQAAIILRYGNFLTSVGSYMCLAFAALLIRQWNEGVLGLSAGVTAAMSVSICALAEVLGMLAAPILGKRIREKKLLLFSTILLIVSNLACFFATTSAVVLIMRFLAGLGFAGNKQATNIMIAMCYQTHEERENNLAESNAGIIGGILCGSGLGAIIAGVAGYAATFAGAALLFVCFGAFYLYFIPWKLIRENSAVRETEKIDFKRVVSLLKSPEILRYSLTVNFPIYLYMMVIVTLIPAVIQGEGLPAVVLTYCNLLNGLAGLYVGVKLVNRLQRYLGRRKALFVISIAGAAAILMLSGQPLIVLVLISAVINGLVDGAGTPLATDEFLELKNVRTSIDEATALALFSIIGFVVMTIAPILLETCVKNNFMMVLLPILMVGLALFLLKGNGKKDKGIEVCKGEDI